MKLSQSLVAKAWLDQFPQSDSRVAELMLDELLLVSRDSLVRGICGELDEIARKSPLHPMALYAEREIALKDGDIEAYFPGTETGRATGVGAPAILASPENKEIGSEGLLANLITNYCRSHPQRALSHPGPDAMREGRVWPVVIVSDFIGSGKRVWEMLESLSKVATLQSWRSYHRIEFHVVAYSGTAAGMKWVSSNRLKPEIHIVAGCPSIFDAFETAGRKAVLDLCRRYPPRHRRPFGFHGIGSLIAFAHGMPNNCPSIFHSSKGGWVPLFPRRGTASAEYQFPSDTDEAVPERARNLLKISKMRRKLDDEEGHLWVQTMLVLKALELGSRTVTSISAKARVPLKEVRTILGFIKLAGWTTDRLRLTKLGRLELLRLHRRRKSSPILPTDDVPFYYPAQLRVR